ncbi:MAG: hypothetical protein ACRDN0_35315, partial [Trebonia sp.]
MARLSADELGQSYLMRRLLETELLRRIGPVLADTALADTVLADEVAVLAEFNARMEALVDHPTPAWKHLNRELHFRMFRLSGLPHVVAEVSRLRVKTALYIFVFSAEK